MVSGGSNNFRATNVLGAALQHEVGVRNLEILNAITDAKGRRLEVVKVHCPPPLFRTYKEAAGVHVSLLACPALS